MALSKSTMKQTIIDAMQSYMGDAEDEDKRADFAEAIADAFLDILKNQAAVKVDGVTGTGGPVGPYPIVAQPGVIL